MLNGVGGRTIAEAKRNMTMVEARQWADYIRRHGGLNVAERVEQAAALICTTACQLMGNKKTTVKDFIPNREGDDELKLATPQDFMKVLQASRKT
ncbi:hypothetical protein [Pseudomonas tolaasii]